MFRLFKSKDLAEKEARVTEIGKMLFQQISIVRDKAHIGRIDENAFNQRINSMYSAGYLIGYVDEHLSEMFTDERSKSKYAERILEGIFPGSGVKLVQSKLAARRLGETISTDSDKFMKVLLQCQEFDTGMRAARYEVSEYLLSGEYTPNKLERYLFSGEIE